MIKDYSKFIEKCIDDSRNQICSLANDYNSPSSGRPRKPAEKVRNLISDTKPHPMSTEITQNLLNNLCSFGDARYLEIGVLHGASYFAAAYKNAGHFYGIDDWSKYEDKRKHIEANIEIHSNDATKFHFFNEDCWNLDLSKVKHKINVFFYDGDHSKGSQERYLKHFDSILDDEIILIVDDYFNTGLDFSMKDSTKRCIEKSSFEIVCEYELQNKPRTPSRVDNTWHEGFYVAHLKRKII
jgi:predicted O-methyltransferase YrrM